MGKKILSILFIFALLVNFAIPAMALADEGIVVSNSSNSVIFSIAGNDITSALSNAFSYCSSATKNNPYTIKVPSGEYTISYSLTPSSYTTLDLSDNVTLVDVNTNIFSSKKDVGKYNGTTDFCIKGGTLTYPEHNSNSGCLIRLAHAKNITFKNTSFLNNCNSHHVEIAACNNVTFDSCLFEGQSGSLSKTSGEALQIDILEPSKHFKLMPEYDGTMNDGITVTKCTFKNLLRGVGTQSVFAGYYQKNIKITNNIFYNIKSAAITCVNYINSTISTNKISKCGEGIQYYMMLSDKELSRVNVFNDKGSINKNCATAITNNDISVIRTADTPIASSIYIFGNNITAAKKPSFGTGDYYVGNITIRANSITTADHGIRLHNVRNSVISSNTVNGFSRYGGILVDDNSDSNKISSNTIKNFETSINIKDGSDKNTVSSNKITSPEKHGILVQSGCASETISNNTISSCGSNGVLLMGAKTASITSNSISSSKNHGVSIIDNATVSSLSSNTIKKSSSNGIYIEAGSKITNLKSNSVSSNSNNGISSYGNISNISSNTFSSNAFGMYFGVGATASVYNNTYKSNKKGTSYSAGKSKSYKFSNLSTPSVKLSQKSKTATVKWKKVSDATSYQIYRSTSKSGTYSKIATVSSKTLSYKNKKLKKGKTYYYKVRAIRKINSITAYSSYSSVKSIKIK